MFGERENKVQNFIKGYEDRGMKWNQSATRGSSNQRTNIKVRFEGSSYGSERGSSRGVDIRGWSVSRRDD